MKLDQMILCLLFACTVTDFVCEAGPRARQARATGCQCGCGRQHCRCGSAPSNAQLGQPVSILSMRVPKAYCTKGNCGR